jgi:predicted nucleic acid-binding protein
VIVVDASALLELLMNTAVGERVAARISDPEVALHAPHLIDLEVVQVLRRFVRDGDLGRTEAEIMLGALRGLDLERHGHEPLLDRIWSLRSNMTAYDASYVALAEALGARLLTCDARLARAPGSRIEVDLLA